MDLNSRIQCDSCIEYGPETIVGQIRPEISEARLHEDMSLKKKSFAGSWEGRSAQKNMKQLWNNVEMYP